MPLQMFQSVSASESSTKVSIRRDTSAPAGKSVCRTFWPDVVLGRDARFFLVHDTKTEKMYQIHAM
jgi:hypothetical protein